MHGRQVKLSLTRMFCAPAYSGQQQWPAGNGFFSDVREGQPGVPAPPVIYQSHRTGSESATRQIPSGAATPFPWILQLVKAVLGIRPVTI